MIMVFVFEKMKVDDNDVFVIRETTGKLLCASSDPQKLVDFYKNIGV